MLKYIQNLRGIRNLRGKWVLLILVFLSIGFAISARESAPSFHGCQAEYAAERAQKKEPEDFATLFIVRGLAYRCTNRLVEAHKDAVIAIATILLTIVTGGLVWTGYLQIRTTRAQLRAYVFPDSCLLVDGTMLDPPEPVHANEPGIVFVWRNTGQTPAANVISWGQIAVVEPINEKTLIPPKALQNIFANHLGANAAANKALWFGRGLTPNEIFDVQVGVKAIYFYGRIEYRDIFDRDRWTNFRIAYAGKFPPPRGISFRVCEGGNEAS